MDPTAPIPNRPLGTQPRTHSGTGPPGALTGPVGRRRILRAVGVVIVMLTVTVLCSYASYLMAPGDAPLSVRTVDWMRDHGFDAAINVTEQWWYTRNVPGGGFAPASDLPAPEGVATGAPAPNAPTDAIASIQPTSQPGEGAWQRVDGLAVGPDAAQETYVRPDLEHPSVAVDLVRFDQRAVKTTYVPGIEQPGGTGWAWKSMVPASQRGNLLAAFNAGFKFKDTAGGVYTEGRTVVRPLATGLASLVVRSDGTVGVDRWGRDATLTKDVVTVRQNLDLIVDDSKIVDGLTTDDTGRWGSARPQLQYTWRSGIGVDSAGRLIYAAGPQASLTALATALQQAGAVRAMQLDIHDGVVTFNWFRSSNGRPVGTKLTPAMQRDASRFLDPDQRDFFAVQSR